MEVADVDQSESMLLHCPRPLSADHVPMCGSSATTVGPCAHAEEAPACDSSTKKVQHFVIDGKCSNWHQSPIFAVPQNERKPMDYFTVVDFDLLCATIAMQREPLSIDVQRDAADMGVQRMWEGGVLDCLESKDIALQTFCCPSIRYGKNLDRAGFGSCVVKAGIHFLLLAAALISYILFLCAYGHEFLYAAIAASFCVAAYAGYYRIQIRRRFNIKGSDSDGVVSAIDDCCSHFLCGWCALCQEARTLEINNVQDGYWRGRGDTMWVGGYAVSRAPSDLNPPAVITIHGEQKADLEAVHVWNHENEESSSIPLVEQHACT